MNSCQEFDRYIDDYLDDALQAGERRAFEVHCQQCKSCQQKLEHAQALQAALRQRVVPPMSEGFVPRSIRKAVTHHEMHKRGFVRGFGSAMAASVLLVVIGLWVYPHMQDASHQTPSPVSSIPEVTIALETYKKVHLVFDSNVEVAEAIVLIELPEHMEIMGFPGEAQFSWSTPLKQGRNVLPLPIKALEPKNGELHARISFAGKKKSIRIQLNVQDERVG